MQRVEVGKFRNEALQANVHMAEAVGAATIAGSYRTWARLAPLQAEALLFQAEQWGEKANALLALAVGAGGLV